MDSRTKRSGESKFTMRADDLESQWASDGVVGSVEGSSGADSIHTPYDLRPYRKTAAGLWIPEPMVPSSDERALESFQDASLNDRLKNNMPARVMQGPPLTRLGAGGSEQFETGRFAYEALAGMLGDGRLASGNVSDVSVSSSEKNEVPFSNYFTGMKSMAKNASFSSASGDPGPRVKFMSSFGGKILPRPGDGKLRYVGGETRIISVNRNISYSDLLLKLKQSYGQALLMKYQLPDEDLDALISVSSEEDLENMMEEYDRLDAGEGSSRLRVFLFSATDYDVGNLTVTVDPRNSEQSYVDAINSSVESGIRKHIDNGYAGSSQNLMGHDISGAWNTNQMPDNVSVSLLGSPVPQDAVTSMVQTVEVGMPVPPRPAIPKIPLGLTSTSPSPLAPSQLFHNKHSAIPDVALQFLPDQHGKVIGHKYAASRSDVSHQDPESGGSASSSVASQHDFQRVSDSPIRAQHEMISLGNHQDPVYWAEPWRMVETVLPKADSRGMMPGIESPAMVPRVESYGKLTQVQDQRLDITQSGPKDRRSDNHFSGILLPQVEVRATLQQHQSPLSQPAAQHPFEAYPDSYTRVDLVQQPVSGAGQAWQQVLQQQQVSDAYAPALRHEAALYKQMEQSQQQGDIRNGHMAHKPLAAQMGGTQSLVGIATGPNFQIGSAPSSPRMEFQDNTGKPLRAPQLLQVNQVHIGDFADQQYGWMLHQQNEQLNRAFLSSDSSPGYFERVSPTEDRFTYQQTMVPFVDSENVPEDQGAPASLQGRQAREGHLEDQGNLLNQNVNANLVFQKQQLQPRYPINPFYKDMDAEEDWVQQQSKKGSDDARVGTEGWSHVVNMNLKEEEVNADSVARSHAQAAGSGNFQAVKVLEGLNPFLVPVVDSSRATPQLKNEQQDLLENSAFNIRAALLPPVTGLHSQAVGKTVSSDTFQAVHLAARSETSQTASRTGNKMEDSKSISSYAEVPFGTRGSNTNTDLAAAQRLLDDRISGNVSTQKAPPVTYFMPSSGFSTPEPVITAGMAEGHWNGHFGLDSMGLELVGLAPGQSVHFHVDATDGKSGLTLNNELSRSAIGGNASVVEVASNAISSVELGPTSCKSLIDDDAIVPPYAMHMQTSDTATVSSYPMAVATLAAGLGSFTLNKASSLESSNSVAGSTTSSPVAEKSAPLSSSVPPIMGTSPFCVPTSIAVDFLAEEIKGREGITAADIAGLMSASSDISFCSPGKLDGKGLFPVFDSVSIKEQTAQEKSQVNTFMRHYSHGHEDDDSKGELKHVAEDVAEAVLEPNLDSSPTLSIQNWENPLVEADLEPHSKENFLEERSLDEEKLRKEVTFEDIIVVEEAEDDGPKMNKSSKLAAIAEADAIASGLQVIKNADLEELRELGSGTFGTVYHGKWRGTDVAIKRIKPSCFGGRPSEQERLRADFWSEAHILGLLHHPNVVAFYGVVRDGPGGALATVTEYMVNGSLKQVLQKKDRTIDRRKRLVVAMDAAFGMEYLHEKNIVHFDLKCENLLVNMRDPQRPICKVADLGLSKVKKQTMVSGGVRGTLPWMAPELLNGSSSLVSEKVDVFSFGIVMWEILTGEEPYANMHYGAIIGGIVNNTLRPPIPSWSDSAWKSLMERCWSADPLERPSFSQIAAELRAMASSLSGRGQAQAHVKMQ